MSPFLKSVNQCFCVQFLLQNCFMLLVKDEIGIDIKIVCLDQFTIIFRKFIPCHLSRFMENFKSINVLSSHPPLISLISRF